MLRKGSIADVKQGVINRQRGHIVVAMCHYPRGMSKSLIDEYVKTLAPRPELLKDFLAAKRKLNPLLSKTERHNAAFIAVRYEQRFELREDGVENLRRLANFSSDQDVYLICQCDPDQRCHRELLLIAAKKWFNSKTELRFFSYPVFERRLPEQAGAIQ